MVYFTRVAAAQTSSLPLRRSGFKQLLIRLQYGQTTTRIRRDRHRHLTPAAVTQVLRLSESDCIRRPPLFDLKIEVFPPNSSDPNSRSYDGEHGGFRWHRFFPFPLSHPESTVYFISICFTPARALSLPSSSLSSSFLIFSAHHATGKQKRGPRTSGRG